MAYGSAPKIGTWLSCVALLAAACGDDLSNAVDDSGSTGVGTSTGADVDETDTTTPPPTSDGSTAAVDSSGSESSSGGPPFEVEVQAFTYPNQPMVVDLAFSAPGLDITVSDPDDPGVRTGPIEGPEGETWIRARGLAPDTAHALDWVATNRDDNSDEGQIEFTTEVAQPGFVPSFTVEGTGGGADGYLLFDLLEFAPDGAASLYALDREGTTRWHLGRIDQAAGANAVFAGATLRDDGSVLFLRDLTLFIVDELGTEQMALTSEELGLAGLHHDVIELDNGNFLSMSFTFRDIDYPDIGLTHVAGDLLVEVDPAGTVVWEWDSFDYLDPLRRRDGFEILIFDPETEENGQDWTHGNGLVYDAETDTILFSIRHQDWIVQIDRATGDLMWRFGPEGDFALTEGTWQYHQHSPQWQADGSLLLYDNGLANPDVPDELERSRAVRYAIDTDAMTATQVWEDAPQDFIAPIAGDADRLTNGNLLITDSSIDMAIGEIHARVREISEARPDNLVWSFTTAIGTFIYRCTATDRLPGESR